MQHDMLFTVAALVARLDDPTLVVFDCRHDLGNATFGTTAYAAGHVPGARFAHVDHDLAAPRTGTNGRHPLPDRATFIAWLGRQGVGATTQVVAYDGQGSMYAARLWWMLTRWLGHARCAVLDGGWDAWVKAGHAVSTQVPTPTAVTYVPGDAPAQTTVDAATLVANLDGGPLRIIDARAADRFRGQNETIDPVAGHIPGARNRVFRENLDAAGCFKSAAELRAGFAPLLEGSSPAQVVHQCGSGITAAHNLLAMELAGLGGSRLYPGSWSEWCADPSRPVATGD
ncbi:MAG: sulfurtransferase [Burkholderiales bacterium]|nr:sulfurtransferase [Burkholderiales bacterium]